MNKHKVNIIGVNTELVDQESVGDIHILMDTRDMLNAEMASGIHDQVKAGLFRGLLDDLFGMTPETFKAAFPEYFV